jgi:hypothetical protein
MKDRPTCDDVPGEPVDPLRTETVPAPAGDSADDRQMQQIEREIARTRIEVSHTVDEIEQRLSPRHLVLQATEAVKDATKKRVGTMVNSANEMANDWADRTRATAGTMREQVREHPLPAALLALGLGWLANKAGSSGGGSARRAAETGDWESHAGMRRDKRDMSMGPVFLIAAGAGAWLLLSRSRGAQSVSDPSDCRPEDSNVGERLSSMTDATQRRLTHAASLARSALGQYSKQMQSQCGRMLRENPLAIGIAALAVGACFGLAIPETELENEYLGEARDGSLDRGRDLTQHAVERVKDTVADALDSARATEPT